MLKQILRRINENVVVAIASIGIVIVCVLMLVCVPRINSDISCASEWFRERVLILGVDTVGIFIVRKIGKKCIKKLDEIDSRAEAADFLEYLGDQKLEVELVLEFEKDEIGFCKLIGNPNRKYYVKKIGIASLYIWACEGDDEKEKGHLITEDYNFFFTYFCPLYMKHGTKICC